MSITISTILHSNISNYTNLRFLLSNTTNSSSLMFPPFPATLLSFWSPLHELDLVGHNNKQTVIKGIEQSGTSL